MPTPTCGCTVTGTATNDLKATPRFFTAGTAANWQPVCTRP